MGDLRVSGSSEVSWCCRPSRATPRSMPSSPSLYPPGRAAFLAALANLSKCVAQGISPAASPGSRAPSSRDQPEDGARKQSTWLQPSRRSPSCSSGWPDARQPLRRPSRHPRRPSPASRSEDRPPGRRASGALLRRPGAGGGDAPVASASFRRPHDRTRRDPGVGRPIGRDPALDRRARGGTRSPCARRCGTRPAQRPGVRPCRGGHAPTAALRAAAHRALVTRCRAREPAAA